MQVEVSCTVCNKKGSKKYFKIIVLRTYCRYTSMLFVACVFFCLKFVLRSIIEHIGYVNPLILSCIFMRHRREVHEVHTAVRHTILNTVPILALIIVSTRRKRMTVLYIVRA